MVRCPECASSNTEQEDWEEVFREEDEHTKIIREYWRCKECGCEFTVRSEESEKIIIDKHGNQLFQSQ